MGLREITMTNLLISENSRNDLLLIASTILFRLILGPRKRTYPPLMRLVKGRQFILAMHFIFTNMLLLPQRSALFPTKISTVLHRLPILQWLLLLDLIILLKKKKLEREGDITGLIEVTVMGVCIMERDASREPFGFAMDVLGSTRKIILSTIWPWLLCYTSWLPRSSPLTCLLLPFHICLLFDS